MVRTEFSEAAVLPERHFKMAARVVAPARSRANTRVASGDHWDAKVRGLGLELIQRGRKRTCLLTGVCLEQPLPWSDAAK